MNCVKCFRVAVWVVTVMSLMLGNHIALAAGPPKTATVQPVTQVADVELGEGGSLSGIVVDGRGLPLANATVAIGNDRQLIATTRSDKDGIFRVSALKGGMYRVHVKDGTGVFRLWTANTAPPTAHRSVMVVSDKEIFAAQSAPLKVWLADPFVMAGIVAIAVAVPVAVAAGRDSGS